MIKMRWWNEYPTWQQPNRSILRLWKWVGFVGAFVLLILPISVAVAQGSYTIASGTTSTQTLDEQSPQQKNRKKQTHVTLIVRDSTLKFVIDELARQAGLQPLYNKGSAVFNKRISVRLVKAPLLDGLSQVLRGTGLVAKLSADGATMLIRPESGDTSTLGQETESDVGTISGIVVDSATEKPVSGAKVYIVGTTLSTVVDEKGSFIIRNAPAGKQTVSIRLFGFRSLARSVTIAGKKNTTVRFILIPVPTTLSGVVTTATGQQRRFAVGNDITSIDVDSVMKTAPITSVTDLLEGRVPGLTVIRASGTPGDPARIRIRGASSIERSNDPIVIVDGVRQYFTGENSINALGGTRLPYARPSALDQIDPNAIETIEVFKGPSASAMYGSDAANGVIVITTKRGRAGPTRWTLLANTGTSSIPGRYPEFTYSFGHTYTGGSPKGTVCNRISKTPCIIDSMVTFQALNDPRYSPLDRGRDYGVSASVSGGSQSVLYSMTGSMKQQNGMVKLPRATEEQFLRYAQKSPPSWMINPDQYQIWSLTSQVSFILNPKARTTLTNLISVGEQRRSSLGTSGIGALIGKFVDTARLNTPSNVAGQNALLTGFSEQAVARTTTSTTTGTFNWQAKNWLNVSATGGINQNSGVDKRFTPAGIPLPLVAISTDTAGGYSLGRRSATVLTMNLGAVTQSTILGGRVFRSAWGFNGQNTQSDAITGLGAVVNGIDEPTSLTGAQQSMSGGATFGWYVEPTIQLSPRFSFAPGIRLDGSGVSGSRAGLLRLPKMSTSWIAIDNTSVEENTTSQWRHILSLVRLRGALGYAGVQPEAADQYRLFRELSKSLDGSTNGTKVVALNSLGNTRLRPERSTEFETGIDADLLQSRFSLTATYFYKKRIDAIVEQSVAASVSGGNAGGVFGIDASKLKQNVGNILSTGIELTGTARVLDNQTATVGINFSFSSRNDKLLTINKEILSRAPGELNSRLVVGYPLDGIWIQPMRGYGDKNSNGIIDVAEVLFADSMVYLGTQNPRFLSTFGTDVGLFNGRVRANLQFNYQGDFTQKNTLGLHYLNSTANQSNSTLEQQAILASTLEAGDLSRYLYQTVNTLRLNSAAINYRLPGSVARLFGAQMATVGLQGSNLWLHTNYNGKDPNVNSIIGGEGVADTGQLPSPRVWVLQFNLSR